MGKIRSAWEIALERTDNIEIDAEKIRHKETIDKIRRAAGAFLIADNKDEESLRNSLKDFNGQDIKEALKSSVINGLSLPQEEVKDDRYDRLQCLLDTALNDENADALFSQIVAFLKQYPLHKKQLIDQLKAQAEPMLREKEEKIKNQYGEDVHLSLENDKEFLNILDQNLKRLDDQYNQTLDGAKAQLETLFS